MTVPETFLQRSSYTFTILFFCWKKLTTDELEYGAKLRFVYEGEK